MYDKPPLTFKCSGLCYEKLKYMAFRLKLAKFSDSKLNRYVDFNAKIVKSIQAF